MLALGLVFVIVAVVFCIGAGILLWNLSSGLGFGWCRIAYDLVACPGQGVATRLCG
jgi:hypothetical protein